MVTKESHLFEDSMRDMAREAKENLAKATQHIEELLEERDGLKRYISLRLLELAEKEEHIAVLEEKYAELRKETRKVIAIPQGDGCPACRNKDRALANI